MPSDDQHVDQPAPGPSVFLSYASADRTAARALRDTLAAAGLDVWLDEDELGGGEAWDAKIRTQIRTCTYFMPLISATTETRREGYFRREWRFAVERTLDLADDVLFLVPVVIDETRDRGARVPEKFFSVQWLRVPGGEATPELRQLATRLATGEALAHPPVPPAEPPLPTKGRKRKETAPPPPFPTFPAYPEPGHHFRFCYNIVLWAGHMVHALWMHLPRVVRLVAAVVIVFNLIAWAFRETNNNAEKKAKADEIREGVASPRRPTSSGGPTEDSIKNLIGAAAHAFQTGKPLAVVTFGSAGDEASTYAGNVFTEIFKLLQQNAGEVSFSPIPLEEHDDDDDALARGTNLESQFVLTGFARRAAPGEPLLLTVKLYQVKQRTVIWSEVFDPSQVATNVAAQRIVEAVRARTIAPAETR